MTSYNLTVLAGNLTRDPEVRYLANDKCVASFSIAVNRRWKDAQGQPKEATTFVDCKAWGHLGEIIGANCTKGKNILVQGQLEQEKWKDPKDGTDRSKLVLNVTLMQFIGAPTEQHEERPRQAKAPAQPPAPAFDGEPPF